jgi:hypothetical protein
MDILGHFNFIFRFSEKLLRMKHTRLIKECPKLEPAFERALSEEGLAKDAVQWPAY